MQTATITIVVESTGKVFDPKSNDIYLKALSKLQAGEYTADVTDKPE